MRAALGSNLRALRLALQTFARSEYVEELHRYSTEETLRAVPGEPQQPARSWPVTYAITRRSATH